MVNFKEEIAAPHRGPCGGTDGREIGAMIEAPQDKSLGRLCFSVLPPGQDAAQGAAADRCDIAAAISASRCLPRLSRSTPM